MKTMALDVIFEIFVSILAGIITMPIILEGYVYVQRWMLQKQHTEKIWRLNQGHQHKMKQLRQEWNNTVEKYSKKLTKVEKKLQKYNIFVDVDEKNNEIVIKKVPVNMSFRSWLKQRRW